MVKSPLVINLQFIQTIKPILIISGWWPANLSKKTFLGIYYSWSLTIYFGIFFFFGISVITHFILYPVRAGNESEARAETLAFAVTAITTSAKVIMMKINDFPIILAKIIKEENVIAHTTDKNVRFLYTQQVKNYKNVIKGITYITLGAIISFIGKGIYKYLYGDHGDVTTLSVKETVEEPIMFPIWLPFKERGNIVVVFLINYFIIFIGTIMYLTFFMSLATVMIFTATLFEIVQIRIKNMDFDIYESERKVYSYKYLLEIAREHLYAIEFVNRLNGFIQYVVLVDFFFNSLSMAAVIVQILTVKTLKDFFFPLAYTLNVLMQILGMGYLSNEIKVQSLAVADALYQTNWYNKDVRFRRVLLLMMVRAQRPLTISIGPFGAMTNEKVFGTMKAAYTYITIMYNNK